MTQTRSAPRRVNWRAVLLASAFLFVSSFATPLEVQVLIEGVDVSRALGRAWSVLTGIATLVSSLLTARNYYDQRENNDGSDSAAGPDTSIRFGNIEGDVNVVVDEDGHVEARETVSEDENSGADAADESGEGDAGAGRVDDDQKREPDEDQKSEPDANMKRNAKN